MVLIEGYTIKEKLFESSRTTVYRGIKDKENLAVIIKVLKLEYPTPEEITKFKREYELGKHLNIEGVVKTYYVEKCHNTFALVLEDFGGESIAKMISTKKMDLLDFLKISSKAAKILGNIHKNNIIHMDIKPHNIVVNLPDDEIKFIDFGLSSQLSREKFEITKGRIHGGTYKYISPEQTGFLNRAVDYRTDIYSLGATFYEMLVGVPPFNSKDEVYLINCHIAQNPIPPIEVDKNIPKVLSDIIMKCLAKDPDERYKSAYGLYYDLLDCLFLLEKTGNIEEFQIANNDVYDKLHISQKLYGREYEIAILLYAFDRISAGDAGIMTVSGFSGIGKTSLIHEIRKPVACQNAYFIEGKFDLHKRNIPYSALIQAFNDLVPQLFTESEEETFLLKEKFLKIFGNNGQIIIDLFPKFEMIIGKQNPLEHVSAEEQQNRFNFALLNFIKLLARKEHPLVVFFDDMQWADIGTLNLLKQILSDKEIGYLFIIGAYRDNEVNLSHPLITTIKEIEKTVTIFTNIKLQPLDFDNINSLVSDSFFTKKETTRELTEIIIRKTGGNPFFIDKFLVNLYEKKLIDFDFEEGWIWNIDKIKEFEITENVVELMIEKITNLKPETIITLKLASCIGNVFDLKTLSIVNGKSLRENAVDLWEALEEGLIFPIDNTYKFYQDQSPEIVDLFIVNLGEQSYKVLDLSVSYKFAHDKIRFAAYSLFSKEEKNKTHYKIGWMLITHYSRKNQLDEEIFDIVNHFDLCIDLIKTETEKYMLAELNLQAGLKAKESAAFNSALKYFSLGVDLLPQNCWIDKYDITSNLYIERAELEYLNGNLKEAKFFFDIALNNCKTVYEKIRVYGLLINYYNAITKFEDLKKTAMEAFKLLKISFPKKVNRFNIFIELLKIKRKLNKKKPDDLMNLPLIKNQQKIAILDIFVKTIAPCYFIDTNLFFILIAKMIAFSLENGLSEHCSFSFVCYGIYLCGTGDIKKGSLFGKLSIEILNKFNSISLKPKVLLLYSSFISCWIENFDKSIDYLIQSYKNGFQIGDLQYISYSINIIFTTYFIKGMDIDFLLEEFTKYSKTSQLLNQQVSVIFYIWGQMVLNLKGKSKDKLMLIGNYLDEEVVVPHFIKNKIYAPLAAYYTCKMFLYFLFREYKTILELAKNEKIINEGMFGTNVIPLFYFIYGLSIAGNFSNFSDKEKKKYMKKLKEIENKFTKWTFYCPSNHAHQYYLIKAEINRILNKEQEAMAYYDKAIESAQTYDFTHIEGIANELAANFYVSKKMDKISKSYFRESYYCYLKWGADAKINDFEKTYVFMK
ncbi:MAG: hypothetical protein A2Y34_06000 [Spirochaetes bacterium GWC1_27_15]|nr:MAG: hypothetical protein A2Z98_17185 [Spirochaetes bacterium GWB1_27_13]OHD22338.1 MAG: hypothetical protein A2Y34_06000 [Spirochaetes bacterium GWC1_27_15]